MDRPKFASASEVNSYYRWFSSVRNLSCLLGPAQACDRHVLSQISGVGETGSGKSELGHQQLECVQMSAACVGTGFEIRPSVKGMKKHALFMQ